MTCTRRLAVLFLILAAVFPATAAAQTPNPKDKALAEIKAHYTKYEYRIPMRDGKRLFTAVYVPKDQSQTLSDPADAHAVQRQALRRRSVQGRPRPVAAVRQGGLHLRLPGRARPLDVGGRVRQHAAAQSAQGAAATSTRAPTPTTPSTGWSSTCRNHNGKVGLWGISYPGFYTAAGMIDAHPGAQGRLAAGAGHRLVHRRRLAPQRRPVPAAHVQLPGPLRPAAAGADQEVRSAASITTRPTATISSCKLGPLSQRRATATSRARSPSGTR